MKTVGNMPDASDLLNSVAMDGASRSTVSLRRRLGSGSLAHCLSGIMWMAVVTSAMLTARNADIEQPVDTGVNVGYGASAVAARTAAILSSKK